jgi:thymidylate kinase
MIKPIILLEGPDCSGKTTLAEKLIKLDPNHAMIHNGIWPDIQKLHFDTNDAARKMNKTHTVIIDRLHISDLVYGSVFRNGPAYDILEADKTIFNDGYIKILCLPPKKVCVKMHKDRIEKEDFKSNDKVWDFYNDLLVNNKLNINNNWILYNWKSDSFRGLLCKLIQFEAAKFPEWFDQFIYPKVLKMFKEKETENA